MRKHRWQVQKQECVSPLTIGNCWYKSGILPKGYISAPTGKSRERARVAQQALAGEEAAQPAMHPAAMSRHIRLLLRQQMSLRRRAVKQLNCLPQRQVALQILLMARMTR
jgi:hypothetical protein